MSSASEPRRGRLPAAERAERRHAVLDATERALLELGYDKVTMLEIAQRAGASKETLYAWFGSRDGLFAALIELTADTSAESISAALEADRPLRDTLVAFSAGLLTLLTSPTSVALNHAAMSSPALADRLLQSGRHRVGPLVQRYFDRCNAQGDLCIADTGEAFAVLYGLVIRDCQIRTLLGEAAPSNRQVRRQAALAVDQFIELYAN